MEEFKYVAKDRLGTLIRSSLSAADRSRALAMLRTRGLTVVDLQGAPAEAPQRFAARPAGRTARGKRRLRKRVSTTEMAVFCRQLAISVRSGVSLRDAIQSISEDLDHAVLTHAVRQVNKDLHDGASFSSAVARQREVFSPLFVSLIRTAEESGTLAETLEQLASYLDRSDRLERKIKGITAYPLFVAIFFCVVCVLMTVWVLPRFDDIFEGFEATTPLLTRMVFGFNRFLLENLPWLVLALGATAAGLTAYVRSPSGRLHLDRIKLGLPLLGPVLRKFAIARIARNLAMMLRGGVSVPKAFEITAGVVGNRVLEQAMIQARDRIESGSPVAASLAADPEFPRLLVRMTAVGEESGQLPEVLEEISGVYEDQVEGSIVIATALFEPVIIILFGAVILLLIMAVYMPVFKIGASVR